MTRTLNPAAEAGNYRRDIDGLRGIAVAPVVLFHAGIDSVSGGYIGVDVFFVISGFLITTIISRDIGAGVFSVVRFYERRIRRIFPALFAVLAVTSIPASVILLPNEMRNYAQSVLASAIFSSNFLFWIEADYFDIAAETKPLLHTWSLAVEEQFYLAYPLFLAALARIRIRRTHLPVIVIALLSLGLSIALTGFAPKASFYLLHTRLWELLVGASIALIAVRPPASRRYAELGSAAGLLLIGYAVFGFDSNTPFPGSAALVPVTGTALLIICGLRRDNRVSQLLTFPSIVGLGLISYSLYLWHWPLIVFGKLVLQRELYGDEIILLCLLAIVVATLSWRYIELPYRRPDCKIATRPLFAQAGIAVSLAVAFGLAGHFWNGFPERLQPEVARLNNQIDTFWSHVPATCINRKPADNYLKNLCHIGDRSQPEASFLLWGDSHAYALVPGIENASRQAGRKGEFAVFTGCPPLLGVIRTTRNRGPRDNGCQEFNNQIMRHLESSPHIKHVILAAQWTLNVEGKRLPYERQADVYLIENAAAPLDIARNPRVFDQGLRASIERLLAADKSVTIFGPVPEADTNVSAAFGRGLMLGVARELHIDADQSMARMRRTLRILEAASVDTSVSLLLPHVLLCKGQSCRVIDNGIPLYFDGDHLSSVGSNFVVGELAKDADSRNHMF